MFERYTERARRVVFFARYEASLYGSMTIETEHLLLGLLREDTQLLRLLPDTPSINSIRSDVIRGLFPREKISTSVDLPLSNACKRILAYAAEESERLNQARIGTEHLLLGILREENSPAARVLQQHGVKLEPLREQLARSPLPAEHHDVPPQSKPSFLHMYDLAQNPAVPKAGVVPDVETAKRIAEAVWTPLYGLDTIQSQNPFQAELKFNIWIVTGSGAIDESDRLFVVILQFDGRILSVGRGAGNR